jgi:hypothetical protein
LNKHSEKDVRCVEFNGEICLGSVILKVKTIYLNVIGVELYANKNFLTENTKMSPVT